MNLPTSNSYQFKPMEKTAFLYSPFAEDFFIKQPEDFERFNEIGNLFAFKLTRVCMV